MHVSSTVVALFAFVVVAYAKPGGSPLCSVEGAADKLTAGMGANAGKIPCTITADKTSYELGGTVTLTWACTDIDNFQGFLAYASPASDTNKRVGAFTLVDGLKSNKGVCGDAAEQENSVVTHSAPGKFSPNGSISFTAPSTDVGSLNFNFLVVKKVDTGFRWGVYANAVTITSPGGGSSGAEATQTVDAFSCSCPTPMPVSVIRKCTPKAGASTRVVVTKFKTKTETSTETKTKTKTATETVKVTETCGTVAGGEETPSSSMMHESGTVAGGEETPTSKMEHEMTTTNKGDDYGYGSTPTQEGYGSYSGYSAENVDESADDYEDGDDEEDN
ncbi:hypothetical protein BJ742DRAFT_819007 [Cladochytrium replicatum]|nr:hypothetical protein BJ742DRAFT_819007 [Cladochytrium replicatum]